jgi:hypothetical protein
LEHLQRASKIVSEGFSLELQAYNCHVFLNWRELRPDEHYRWDLLCDSLNGRGVAGLDDALVALELAPLHESLCQLLQFDLVAELAGLSGPLPACGAEAGDSSAAAQLMERIENLSTRFAREGLAVYARKTGSRAQVSEKDLWLAICRQVHAAAKLPGLVEAHEAGMVLPSSSSELHPGVVWGPVLAYVVLQGIAQSLEAKETEATALALFDRLRLREPLARAFSGGGEITEDGWRGAARVRLAFFGQTLISAKPAKAGAEEAFAGLPRGIWDDGDARWLLKVNEAGGEWYFNKELHQQILWWTQLPDLLQLAAPVPASLDKKKPAPRPTIQAIDQRIQDASEQAEEAGFRIGKKKEAAAKPAKREKGALAKP